MISVNRWPKKRPHMYSLWVLRIFSTQTAMLLYNAYSRLNKQTVALNHNKRANVLLLILHKGPAEVKPKNKFRIQLELTCADKVPKFVGIQYFLNPKYKYRYHRLWIIAWWMPSNTKKRIYKCVGQYGDPT